MESFMGSAEAGVTVSALAMTQAQAAARPKNFRIAHLPVSSRPCVRREASNGPILCCVARENGACVLQHSCYDTRTDSRPHAVLDSERHALLLDNLLPVIPHEGRGAEARPALLRHLVPDTGRKGFHAADHRRLDLIFRVLFDHETVLQAG